MLRTGSRPALVGVLALNQDGSVDRDISQQVLADYTAAGGPGEANALEPLLRLFFLAVSPFSLTRTARGEGQNPKMVAMMEQALTQLG